MNNLAAAYELQGRRQEAEELLRRLHELHPDYLFARTSLAQLALRKGKVAEAEALLEPLVSQKRFHISEFAALAGAQIDLFLAKSDPTSARSWFTMWESADPENPGLDYWRHRLDRPGRWPRLPGRRG